MCIANHTALVHQDLDRHTAELKQFRFLPVQSKHIMPRIRQTGKLEVVPFEIILKLGRILRSGDQYNGVSPGKAFVIPAQLRQMCPAICSDEPPVED